MSPPCTPPRRQPTTPAGASPANTATTRDNHSNNNKGTITNPCTPPPRPQPTTPAGASPAHTATTRDNNNKPSPVMNAPRAPPPARAPVPAAAAIAATIALLQGLGYAAPDTNNSSSSSQSSSKDNNNNILTGQDMVTTLTEMMNKRVTRLVDEIERDRRELRRYVVLCCVYLVIEKHFYQRPPPSFSSPFSLYPLSQLLCHKPRIDIQVFVSAASTPNLASARRAAAATSRPRRRRRWSSLLTRARAPGSRRPWRACSRPSVDTGRSARRFSGRPCSYKGELPTLPSH